jgi:hypothetical protein
LNKAAGGPPRRPVRAGAGSKKRRKEIGRLFEIAGERRGLLVLSGALSAVSAAFMLVPYAAVYSLILAELLTNSGRSFRCGRCGGKRVGAPLRWPA